MVNWLSRVGRAWDIASEEAASLVIVAFVFLVVLAFALGGLAVFAAKLAVLWGLLRTLFGF